MPANCKEHFVFDPIPAFVSDTAARPACYMCDFVGLAMGSRPRSKPLSLVNRLTKHFRTITSLALAFPGAGSIHMASGVLGHDLGTDSHGVCDRRNDEAI